MSKIQGQAPIRQRDARDTLERLADKGRSEVTLDGQLVAMLASKWQGIEDPLQTAEAGGHTFDYSDILAEHRRLAAGDNLGALVVLLRSTDYGRRVTSPDGKVLWVTVAVAPFGSADDVEAWCRTRFADLTARQRANTCTTTRLTP